MKQFYSTTAIYNKYAEICLIYLSYYSFSMISLNPLLYLIKIASNYLNKKN